MIRLGPKLNTVFASRWKALWWAGGILLTAYCTVPQKGQSNASALGIGFLTPSSASSAAPTHHKSPWDKN
jgi:hypothetical protein